MKINNDVVTHGICYEYGKLERPKLHNRFLHTDLGTPRVILCVICVLEIRKNTRNDFPHFTCCVLKFLFRLEAVVLHVV
jgi:hypothetical protein